MSVIERSPVPHSAWNRFQVAASGRPPYRVEGMFFVKSLIAASRIDVSDLSSLGWQPNIKKSTCHKKQTWARTSLMSQKGIMMMMIWTGSMYKDCSHHAYILILPSVHPVWNKFSTWNKCDSGDSPDVQLDCALLIFIQFPLPYIIHVENMPGSTVGLSDANLS